MYFVRLQKGNHNYWIGCLFSLVKTFVMVPGGSMVKIRQLGNKARFDSHQVV